MSGEKISGELELRRRAEKTLQEQRTEATVPESLGELQRIVHELEVHQIELEMQNDELMQVRSDLESLLVQYTELYDFAPVGYFTLEKNALIQHVNLPGARMLSVDRSRLMKQNFFHFVSVHSQPVFTKVLTEVFKNHTLETAVIELQKEGGDKIYVHVEARVSRDGQKCRTALIDITAQKEIEDLLKESEHKFRTLFENMTQGIMIYDRDGKIISANPAAESILDLTLDQMLAITPTDLHQTAIHEDNSDFPGETHPSMVALRTGKAIHDVVMGVKSQKTRGYIWLSITAVPQFKSGENRPIQVFTTFQDITLIKRLRVYNTLTDREKEVFNWLTKGLSRKIIAEVLDISPKTVDKHRGNLMEKLNLHEKEELISFANMLKDV